MFVSLQIKQKVNQYIQLMPKLNSSSFYTIHRLFSPHFAELKILLALLLHLLGRLSSKELAYFLECEIKVISRKSKYGTFVVHILPFVNHHYYTCWGKGIHSICHRRKQHQY